MSGQGKQKPIWGKVVLTGRIRTETGLHIGASQANVEIGGVDKPVIRDPITREPYIPGSSLKGKLRALLERRENKTFDHHGGRGVYRHECIEPACPVCRLFGAADPKQGNDRNNLPGRVMVRDARLTPETLKELAAIDTGLQYTEWKFENALDRVTAAANPRQLERVPAGSEFQFEIVYTVEASADEVAQDLRNLLAMLALLEDDALGGHGSRGYGKVSFHDLRLELRKVDYYAGDKAAVTITEAANLSECLSQSASIADDLR